MRRIGSIVIVLCLVLSAQGRLGETPEQIATRHGAPIKSYRDIKGRLGYIYHSRGYSIIVQFTNGISQSEVFSKDDDVEITQAEWDAMMAENAPPGEKWRKMPPQANSDGIVMQAWVALRTGTFTAYGPCVFNDRQVQHAVSFGTQTYIKSL
jgi:hypothetical protein